VLAGTYKIAVTKGTICIAGSIISEGAPLQTVYAPMTHALPVIEARPSLNLNRRGDEKEGTMSKASDITEFTITNHESGLSELSRILPGVWKTVSPGFSFSPVCKTS
jgi:hypothetical protein